MALQLDEFVVDVMRIVPSIPSFHCGIHTADIQREPEPTRGIRSRQPQGIKASSLHILGCFLHGSLCFVAPTSFEWFWLVCG